MGGSRGMAGAVALAGMAALRGGAGIGAAGRARCHSEHRRRLRALLHDGPVARRRRRPDRRRAAFDPIAKLAEKATALACGPGLGRSFDLDQLVLRLYQEIAKPMVFDADALNALAAEPEMLAEAAGPRMLTPHPGEFAAR